ncbi:MAG: sulfatase-like hydrolase/transferase, partial [Prosthecobacter sp.]|nr:sulfatase-like hydrolase/transferase [Prosthecobacter sp.]
FKRDVAADPYRGIPGERLLTRLKGNDVLLIFVEAYGRAALIAPDGAPAAQLTASELALREAGYSMRSTWLVSPTFGGASWLAHGTFVAGLWIEDHQRYNTLFVSEHQTLIHDFSRAGWRTAAVMPLFTRPWPEGGFFGFDAIYTGNNLGYAGPSFGYITMPDQFALSAFHRRELAAQDRRPIMAEMALNSSHLPWTPRPHFLPWDAIGDGSVFAAAREGSEADIDWLDAGKMKVNYEKAITYAIQTVFSYAESQVKDPALLIIVGDHQPISMVAGTAAGHEVPIHILSRDPALLESFEGWTDGLMPGAQSPVWKMDAMRGHILNAFSEPPS